MKKYKIKYLKQAEKLLNQKNIKNIPHILERISNDRSIIYEIYFCNKYNYKIQKILDILVLDILTVVMSNFFNLKITQLLFNYLDEPISNAYFIKKDDDLLVIVSEQD